MTWASAYSTGLPKTGSEHTCRASPYAPIALYAACLVHKGSCRVHKLAATLQEEIAGIYCFSRLYAKPLLWNKRAFSLSSPTPNLRPSSQCTTASAYSWLRMAKRELCKQSKVSQHFVPKIWRGAVISKCKGTWAEDLLFVGTTRLRTSHCILTALVTLFSNIFV